MILTPAFRALTQLDDPAIWGVLLKSVALSALLFAGLCVAAASGLHHALLIHGWLAWVAGLLGGAAALVAALFLFLPVATMIAGLFVEPVARAVERRWYPALSPGSAAPLASQLWDGVALGLLVLGMSVLSLLLALLLPGVGLVVGWGITAWALGRGLFVMVAMRRMSRAAALVLYQRHRLAVVAQGAALTLAGTVPILNLTVPLLGTACMVHVLMGALQPGPALPERNAGYMG